MSSVQKLGNGDYSAINSRTAKDVERGVILSGYLVAPSSYPMGASTSSTTVTWSRANGLVPNGKLHCTGGATAITTDTAANIIAHNNLRIGDNFKVTLSKVAAGDITISNGAGVTTTGTTVATVNARDYLVTRNGDATVTIVSLGAYSAVA